MRIAKLRAETRLLEQQISPRGQMYERVKVIAGISGLVTGLVALIGLGLSAFQWFKSAEATREIQIEERLDRALERLSDASASARLAGVVSLSSFLTDEDQQRATQAVLALVNALAIEESATVRNAVVASLEGIDRSGPSREVLEHGLVTLVRASRGLCQEGDLWTKRRENMYLPPEPQSVEARAVSVAAAIVVLLRKGARVPDMSGIYLANVDLRSLHLDAVHFDDAILAWSDFRDATLRQASFDNADLDRVLFERADMKGAKLRQETDTTLGTPHRNYIGEQVHRALLYWKVHRLSPPPIIGINGPDFTCADLAGADFTGHTLIPVYPDAAEQQLQVIRLSLRNANLAGAKLSKLGVFGMASRSLEVPYPLLHGGGVLAGDYIALMGVIDDSRPLISPDGFGHSIAEAAFVFQGSNWRAAKLPRSVSDALNPMRGGSTREQRPCSAVSHQQ